MPPESNVLPPVATPTIAQVLGEFLAEQAQRLEPATFSRCRSIIGVLMVHLNNYGEGLSKAERALFETRRKAEGDERREFCQTFGPVHIMGNLASFLCRFMIRKAIMACPGSERAARTVARKLSKWLAVKGYISKDDAAQGIEEIGRDAPPLPAAERVASSLAKAGGVFFDPRDVPGEDYVEFDHYTITRIEPGRLWLAGLSRSESAVGPVTVPRRATALLQVGWQIGCALARLRGTWRPVEVGNVRPPESSAAARAEHGDGVPRSRAPYGPHRRTGGDGGMEPNTCPMRARYKGTMIAITDGAAWLLKRTLLDEAARHFETCDRCWAELDAMMCDAIEGLKPPLEGLAAQMAEFLRRRVMIHSLSCLVRGRPSPGLSLN